jgi:hypothetical protein
LLDEIVSVGGSTAQLGVSVACCAADLQSKNDTKREEKSREEKNLQLMQETIKARETARQWPVPAVHSHRFRTSTILRKRMIDYRT